MIACLCTAMGFFGSTGNLFELLSNFRVLYVVFIFIALLVALCFKLRVALVISSIAFLINLIPIAPLYLPTAKKPIDKATTVSVLQMNIRPYQNKDYSKALKVIKEKDAEIIGVIELTKDWTDKLIESLPDYPFVFKEEGFGGIMILSKHELIESKIQYTGSQKRPRISTKFKKDGTTFSVILAHTVAPQNGLELRNKELGLVATESSQSDRPLILFGDLNCSPFSYHFDKLLVKGNLSDTERGFGVQNTWSAYFVPFVPIDHVLISKDLACVERTTGPDIGSDHLPVYVKLKLDTN